MSGSTSGDEQAMGLRERKKLKTRAALRERAFELFRSQGYEATTIAQIAAAAEVSPATFFRYFPNKEAVVLEDDFDEIFLADAEMLDVRDGNLPAAIVRHAIDIVRGVDVSVREAETERQRLLRSTPSLRGAWMVDQERSVAVLAGAIVEHFEIDDFDALAIAGAIAGAGMGVQGYPGIDDMDMLTWLERMAVVFESRWGPRVRAAPTRRRR